MTLSSQDSGRTMGVAPGELVTVRLKENPTTGYRWKVESSGGLELLSDLFEMGREGIGAAGVRALQFRAPISGSHVLKMKNWREWEGEISVIDRFDATIVVK